MTPIGSDSIYREYILDHYKNPRNFGRLENPDISHRETNPLCGDEIGIYIKLDSKKNVSEIKFSGRGCAISQASASMLTEAIQGKNLSEIKSFKKENILEMLAIPISPVRLKCAILSLDTLKNGIFIYEKLNGVSNNGRLI